MFEKEIEKLMEQELDPNNLALLKVLKEEFSKISSNRIFSPFAISDNWCLEAVQSILDSLDPRFIAYPGNGVTIISM